MDLVGDAHCRKDLSKNKAPCLYSNVEGDKENRRTSTPRVLNLAGSKVINSVFSLAAGVSPVGPVILGGNRTNIQANGSLLVEGVPDSKKVGGSVVPLLCLSSSSDDDCDNDNNYKSHEVRCRSGNGSEGSSPSSTRDLNGRPSGFLIDDSLDGDEETCSGSRGNQFMIVPDSAEEADAEAEESSCSAPMPSAEKDGGQGRGLLQMDSNNSNALSSGLSVSSGQLVEEMENAKAPFVSRKQPRQLRRVICYDSSSSDDNADGDADQDTEVRDLDQDSVQMLEKQSASTSFVDGAPRVVDSLSSTMHSMVIDEDMPFSISTKGLTGSEDYPGAGHRNSNICRNYTHKSFGGNRSRSFLDRPSDANRTTLLPLGSNIRGASPTAASSKHSAVFISYSSSDEDDGVDDDEDGRSVDRVSTDVDSDVADKATGEVVSGENSASKATDTLTTRLALVAAADSTNRNDGVGTPHGNNMTSMELHTATNKHPDTHENSDYVERSSDENGGYTGSAAASTDYVLALMSDEEPKCVNEVPEGSSTVMEQIGVSTSEVHGSVDNNIKSHWGPEDKDTNRQANIKEKDGTSYIPQQVDPLASPGSSNRADTDGNGEDASHVLDALSDAHSDNMTVMANTKSSAFSVDGQSGDGVIAGIPGAHEIASIEAQLLELRMQRSKLKVFIYVSGVSVTKEIASK